MILAGIDEAGYGPTLGPLVVSVAVFRIEAPAGETGAPADLWERLPTVVARERDGSRIRVNDSKKLFQQKKGLRELEEGLLPFLCLQAKTLPRDLRSLLARVARKEECPGGAPGTRGPSASLDEYPWYRGRNIEIPVDTFANFVTSRAEHLRAGLDAAGVEFIGLAARAIDVIEFNRGIEDTGNKAAVSFRAIASFVRRIWRRFPDEDVDLIVDRQGGRANYGPLLFEAVRPRGIRIETQTEEVSTYHLSRRRPAPDPGEEGPTRGGQGGRHPDFRITFAVDSERSSLPVALASMLSKYLRELHMAIFNRFWRESRAGLRPTAGYAVDARRFLVDIGDLRRDLGIRDEMLIRAR